MVGHRNRPDPIMALPSFTLILGLGLAGLLGGAALLFLAAGLAARRRPAVRSIFAPDVGGTTFLFDGDDLVDATPSARTLLANVVGDGPRKRLMALLTPLFGRIDTALAQVEETGLATALPARLGGPVLQMEQRAGLLRVTVADPNRELPVALHDPVAIHMLEVELEGLRDVLTVSPVPTWRCDEDGQVVWANRAYLLLCDPDMTWPMQQVFAATGRQTAAGVAWDVTFDGATGYALPAAQAAGAEARLAAIRQAMARTFAALPTGIAVFDQKRQLQTFNPALIDMLGLGFEVLSQRPSLMTFLDALRDHAMLPEPKAYKAWRRQVSGLEKAAAAGAYRDTWALPDGRSIRVTGVPHPDGALALMFDDVSQVEEQSARLRLDRDLLQAAVSAAAAATVVVERGGRVAVQSDAYRDLWHDGFAAFGEPRDIRAHLGAWAAACLPAPVWRRIEAAVFDAAAAALAFRDEVRLRDGRLLTLTVRPIGGGIVLTFDLGPQAQRGQPDLGVIDGGSAMVIADPACAS
jgi:PAS domain-containing protein